MNRLKEKIGNLAARIGKKTNIDIPYFLKGGFWLTFAQSISSLESFLLSILFANLMAKNDYGTYKYLIAAAGALSVFGLNGMFPSIVRSVSKKMEGGFYKALKTKMLWSLLGFLASFGIGFFYVAKGQKILGIGFFIIAFFLPFFEPGTLYGALSLGRKNFVFYALGQISEQISNLIFIFAGLIIYPNPIFLASIYLFSYSLPRFVLIFLLTKKNPVQGPTDQETISYGKHLSAMRVFGELMKYLDKILAFNFLGPIDLAVYSMASSPANQLNGLVSQAGNLFLPKYSEMEKERAKKSLTKKTLLFAGLLILAAGFYWLIAPLFFRIFFPQYLESIKYSRIFGLSIIAAASSLPSMFLQGQKETKALYKLNLISPFINAFILIISIQFGLLGIIWGKISISFLNFGLTFWLAKKT